MPSSVGPGEPTGEGDDKRPEKISGGATDWELGKWLNPYLSSASGRRPEAKPTWRPGHGIPTTGFWLEE
jgi:hypothetical protein